MASLTRPRVLCVDDEPLVLEGLTLHLRRRFEVRTAESGAAGLAILEGEGPFDVVVSDMRMPGMDGAAFLARARRLAPHTVRLLLTGHADFDAALAAVNDGQIFRFLTKPCPTELLLQAIAAAAEQHRLVEAERVLLEQTLAGSIKTLTEVLSLSNPVAFGRAVRLKRFATRLCDQLAIAERWHIEAAAQLSQLGCVALPGPVAEKLYFGQLLSGPEKAIADRVPAIADQLLGNIPRLEPVREILASQDRRYDAGGDDIPLGARILRLALDLDALETAGLTAVQAVGALQQRRGGYDPRLLEAAQQLVGDQGSVEVREVQVAALRPGMVFAGDVRSRSGTLLVARGQAVTQSLVERMRNLPSGTLCEPLRVLTERPGGGEA